MKNLQNLKGAHQLSKKEQQRINGGGQGCGYYDQGSCETNCLNGTCYSFPNVYNINVDCWECNAGGGNQ